MTQDPGEQVGDEQVRGHLAPGAASLQYSHNRSPASLGAKGWLVVLLAMLALLVLNNFIHTGFSDSPTLECAQAQQVRDDLIASGYGSNGPDPALKTAYDNVRDACAD
jgi:hypothetical protein